MIFQRMNRHLEMLKMRMDPTNINNVQIKHIFHKSYLILNTVLKQYTKFI